LSNPLEVEAGIFKMMELGIEEKSSDSDAMFPQGMANLMSRASYD
jgi:hypothetical protein